jgi:hypothetical protein
MGLQRAFGDKPIEGTKLMWFCPDDHEGMEAFARQEARKLQQRRDKRAKQRETRNQRRRRRQREQQQ